MPLSWPGVVTIFRPAGNVGSSPTCLVPPQSPLEDIDEDKDNDNECEDSATDKHALTPISKFCSATGYEANGAYYQYGNAGYPGCASNERFSSFCCRDWLHGSAGHILDRAFTRVVQDDDHVL